MPLGSDSTILISVDVSAGSQPAESIVDLCRSVNVVLIGYYPDQDVAPTQVRQDRKSEAESTVAEISETFRDSGVTVTETLVFTYYRQDSVDYAARKYACDAVLTLERTECIERILVPIRGDTNLERIVSLLGDVMRGSDASATFFHSVMENSDPTRGEFLVRGAADRLSQSGIDRDRIDWRLSDDASPQEEIIELGEEYDLLVLGETKPSLRHRILGSVPNRIVDEVDTPAFIVRDADE